MTARSFDCPQCGPNVASDEDGCCASCGATLCDYCRKYRAQVANLLDANKRIASRAKDLQDSIDEFRDLQARLTALGAKELHQ